MMGACQSREHHRESGLGARLALKTTTSAPAVRPNKNSRPTSIESSTPRSRSTAAQGFAIHENAFWGFQTYLGLRENLTANDGGRSFTYDSTRERTPLGHNHRARIRHLSIERIRVMYREAATRLVERTAKTHEFFQAGSIAIDTTEPEPFTGDRTVHEHVLGAIAERGLTYASPSGCRSARRNRPSASSSANRTPTLPTGNFTSATTSGTRRC